MTCQEADQWLWNVCQREAENWFREQSRNLHSRFYLFYKRGNIKIAEDAPKDYKLATGERISLAWTQEQATRWAYNILRRCPCLPSGA